MARDSWDSWDEDGTPHPLALRRTGRSEQEPDRLPEVRELEVLGWKPAPEDTLWVFLPYVWPPADRTWVPDRSTHWAVETRLDGHGHITGVEAAPLADPDLHDLDREAEEVLAALGLPRRPPGRLWLLRPPGSLPRSARSSTTSGRWRGSAGWRSGLRPRSSHWSAPNSSRWPPSPIPIGEQHVRATRRFTPLRR